MACEDCERRKRWSERWERWSEHLVKLGFAAVLAAFIGVMVLFCIADAASVKRMNEEAAVCREKVFLVSDDRVGCGIMRGAKLSVEGNVARCTCPGPAPEGRP